MKETNERWQTTQIGSIPFILFSKHFTELNSAYWAYRPAANTIDRFARDEIEKKSISPLDFFYIEEEHERRLDYNYTKWHDNYSLFKKYTRLNFLMMLSSCFETYYRGVLALAFESKPATILGLDDEIDGVFILKKDLKYGDNRQETYKFGDVIDSLCKGPWGQRVKLFNKYFKQFPSEINVQKLEAFRMKRNEIGHFFGRAKIDYENPLQLNPTPLSSISEDKLLEYFKLIYESVTYLDKYLYKQYIGSYDLIKYYFRNIYKQQTDRDFNSPEQARLLRKKLGALGLQTVEKNFYSNLFIYLNLGNTSDNCRYLQSSCIREINKLIKQLKFDSDKLEKGHIGFSHKDFKNFCKSNSIYENELYCKQYKGSYKYLFSYRIIEDIINYIKSNPEKYIKVK